MGEFTHLMVVLVVGMAVALGATMVLLANLATVVVVAFGSGLIMGLFTGAYLYQVGSKLFTK